MKLFKVWIEDYEYDDYDSFICLANSAEEASFNAG